MYSWSVASMKKSIMFDVLNVIDRANREESRDMIESEFSLLKKNTCDQYNYLYDLALQYDDSIAAAMYIPESVENRNRYTIIYPALIEKAMGLSSFMDLIKLLSDTDKEVNAEYIMKNCLTTERQTISEDLIPFMIRSKDMLSVSLLNDTKLPERIKFSLITLLFNYEEFLATFIAYLTNIHNAVNELYDTYKNIYRDTSNILKNYLLTNDIEKLTNIETQTMVINEEKRKKHIIVLSLSRLEYSRIIYDDYKVIYIKGLFSIQRILHDNNFKIF